jgi:hypothetical protein
MSVCIWVIDGVKLFKPLIVIWNLNLLTRLNPYFSNAGVGLKIMIMVNWVWPFFFLLCPKYHSFTMPNLILTHLSKI